MAKQDKTEATATTQQDIVTLSCGVQGCCPTVDFTEKESVTIRDDFGGCVKLTAAQWQALAALATTRST
ncbi:MAG: hypothetical protein RDU25_02450 [Patescibacteria group bacterium]|nr:hypothetical protein [Patescibacteria group bacterium]